MRGLRIVALVAAVLLTPAGVAASNVEVAWPQDLGAPYSERAAAIQAALGIDLRYVVYSSAYPAFELLPDTGAEAGRSTVTVREAPNQTIVVDVLHGDGTAFRYTQPFERFVYTTVVEPPISCVVESRSGESSCSTATPIVKEHPARSVQPSDLRTGIVFEALNEVTIEGPPGTFAVYGRGLDAAAAVATRLGIPWEWTAEDFFEEPHGPDAVNPAVLELPLPWWKAPGVNRVMCDCRSFSLREGNVSGAGTLWFVQDADGQLLQFGSTVWHALPSGPLGPSAALGAMRLAYPAEHGYDVSLDRARLLFLPTHGLVWQTTFDIQSAAGAVRAESLTDAATGETLAEAEHVVRGPKPPGWLAVPWPLPALLVAAVALLLVAYRPRGGSAPAGFVLPQPPRFEDED